jgi:hypothetical protein
MDNLIAVQIVDCLENCLNYLRSFLVSESFFLLFSRRNQLRELAATHQLHAKKYLAFELFNLYRVKQKRQSTLRSLLKLGRSPYCKFLPPLTCLNLTIFLWSISCSRLASCLRSSTPSLWSIFLLITLTAIYSSVSLSMAR